jgi:hypothetical protein
MADEPGLGGGGLGAQPRPVHESVAGIWIDGEAAGVAGGEVLEKMAALRRVD